MAFKTLCPFLMTASIVPIWQHGFVLNGLLKNPANLELSSAQPKYPLVTYITKSSGPLSLKQLFLAKQRTSRDIRVVFRCWSWLKYGGMLEEKIHQSMAAVDDKHDWGHQRQEQWISELTPAPSNVENYHIDQVCYIHEEEPVWFMPLLLEVWKKATKMKKILLSQYTLLKIFKSFG